MRPQAPAQLPPLAPSKPKGRNLNPFSSGDGQVAGRLLQLAKNKDKDKEKEKKEKEKKKKKGKAGAAQGTGEESGDEDVQGTRL